MNLVIHNTRRLHRRLFPIFNRLKSTKSNASIFVDEVFINHRSTDRTHRQLVNSLSSYKQKPKNERVVIEPTIRHLLVKFQKEFHDKRTIIEIHNTFPTPFKTTKLLEPVIFHIIISLHHIINSRRLGNLSSQELSQTDYLTKFLHKLKPGHLIGKIRTQIGFDCDVKDLATSILSKLNAENSRASTETLELGLICFLVLNQTKFRNQYSVETDLIPWIRAILSKDVTSSCELLMGLTNIPACILSDIILRSPVSKVEYHLQLEMWNQFIKPISETYIEKVSHLKACINNLIYYGVRFDTDALKELITDTFNFLMDPRSGIKIEALETSYINEILWNLALMTVFQPVTITKIQNTNIINSQEILVGFLSKQKDNTTKAFEKLSLKAYMGIAIAIRPTSQQKSEQLMNMAEKRFFSGRISVENKDMVAYNIAKTYLANSPEALVHTFNSAAKSYSHSSVLWLAFVQRLKQFGLLNENRSIKVLKELLKIRNEVMITKDIMNVLIWPHKGLKSLDRFIQTIAGTDEKLLASHSETILPKYITMLYINHNSKTLSENYYLWDRNLDKISKLDLWTYKGFPTVAKYAKYLYDTQFRKKSANIIGIMLQGEAIADPTNVYDLYKSELSRNNVPPNRECLVGLLRASFKTNDDNACIVWGDLYAPQVAVHEFKKHVVGAFNEDGFIYATDSLWQIYIQMLAKYGYVSELAEIIQWWEHIKFTPHYETLLHLMAALPSEYGQRYIEHFNKVKIDSDKFHPKSQQDWNWPTLEELESFKKNDKRFRYLQ